MCQGPQMRPNRPDTVPSLDLEGLPEYVTTSEEEDNESKQQLVEDVSERANGSTIPSRQSVVYEEQLKYVEQHY